jgi:hypothetical protein
MKGLFSLALILAIAFALISCGGETPKSVVTTFIEKAKSGDIDGAMGCTRKVDQQAYKDLKVIMDDFKKKDPSMAKDDKFDLSKAIKEQASSITIIDENIDGEKATVGVKMKDKTGTEKSDKIELIKEDNKWVINMKLDQAVQAFKQMQQMSNQAPKGPDTKDEPALDKKDAPAPDKKDAPAPDKNEPPKKMEPAPGKK